MSRIFFAYDNYKDARQGLIQAFVAGTKLNHSAMTITHENGDVEFHRDLSHPNDAQRIMGLELTNYKLIGEHIPRICIDTLRTMTRL